MPLVSRGLESATIAPQPRVLMTVSPRNGVVFGTLERREDDLPRIQTGLACLDHALGGGVCGVILLVGKRGVGKSTFTAALLEAMKHRALLIGVEEDQASVERRATRAGGLGARYTCERDLERVLAAIDALEEPPALVVIDSLHRLRGNPAQNAEKMCAWSHRRQIPIVAIARENKAGEVSGSADIESEVDVVLVILKNQDGSRSLHITKNRFSEHEGIYQLVLTSRGFSHPSEGENR
jgi:predicted ATP-dependent serine protease